MVKELSIVLEGLARETDRQKSLKKSMASTIADLEQRRADLASKITLGRENRDVAVAMLADYVAGTVTEVRQDTFEVVRSRPLRDDEKQVPLIPMESPPAEEQMEAVPAETPAEALPPVEAPPADVPTTPPPKARRRKA